jgi:N-acetylmuramoyl-L-alanine amidase
MEHKMKNQILILLFLVSSILFAQDFDGLKIYINPGHGGNDPSNDRYIPETGFWESESNLTKGLYLRDLLESLNAVVFMSRTENREVDDLPLSQIDADANANNVDLFHSIHSNAFNASTNYTLLLYKETNSQPVDPLSRDLGNIITDEINKADRTTGKYNRGDYSFLGYHLGVLNYLNYNIMRGTLSEGSFHDYLPESFRLMSIPYRKHEAIAILRSFINYYGLDPLPYGIAAGIVRAKDKQVEYSYNYNSSLPNDSKLALNNTKVTLLPAGNEFITDNNNNGFFIFDSLDPGEYQLIFDSGEYNSDTLNITVQANKTNFADAFLTENPDKAPFIYSTLPAQEEEAVSTYSLIEINFSRSMNPDSVEAAFSIEPTVDGTFSWERENQTMKFRPRDAYQLNANYSVKVSKKATSIFGVPLESDFEFGFTTAAEHVRPQVINFYPGTNIDSVFTHTEITIEFDSEMRPGETEAAFSIDPYSSGTFTWEENHTKLVFKPDQILDPGVTYSVTLSSGALNYYGIALAEELDFSFKTRIKNRIEILQTYPTANLEDVSTEVWSIVKFDGLLDESTILNTSFSVISEAGKIHAIRYFELSEENNQTVATFKPQPSLEPNQYYKFYIFPGIASAAGLTVQDTIVIPFQTDKTVYVSGTTVEGFENLDNWLDPNAAPYSTRLDSTGSNALINSKQEIGGSYRAELDYAFSDTAGGVYQLFNPTKISVGSNTESEFGIWIFGDYSFNRLEFWFDAGEQTNLAYVCDSINWYGYKFIRFPLSILGGEGEYYFHSIIIKQNSGGLQKSVLFADEAQIDVVVGLEDRDRYTQDPIPEAIKLLQNYPNPFNPVTTISFEIPKACRVSLTVYNIRGQKIAELVNDYREAGSYRVEFDGSDLSSGLYFYRINAGNFTDTRRMLLIK